MELVEYKRHLINGVLVDPEWIVIGNIFGGSSDNTLIGAVLPENERAYYIPDTVVSYTIEEIKGIQREKTFERPVDPDDPHSELHTLTADEINDMVDQKLSDVGVI